jgi:hypothetical protein
MILEYLIWAGLAASALISYFAVSLGPYAAGKGVGTKETLDRMVAFSLEDPEGFEIWLRTEQINAIRQEKSQLEKKLTITTSATTNEALA